MNISAVPTTNMILKMEQDSLLKNTKAINGPKVPRGKNGQTKWTIHDCYTKYPNSESELVEFLKWIQKGEK